MRDSATTRQVLSVLSQEVQPHDEANSDGYRSSTADSNPIPILGLTAQSQVAIEIKDFAYSQQNIKIKKRHDRNLDKSGHCRA